MEALAIDAKHRRLGPSALRVFPIAYGAWRFAGTEVREARAKVEAALECGITLFDHADIYGGEGAAEDLFGRVLGEAPQLRDAMIIASKCGIVAGTPYDSSRAHIRRAAEGSLRRLRIDVIDLYQIHRPDWLAHPGEVAEALIELREAGKIREVGVSNHTAAQVDALRQFLPFPIATHQPELSAVWLEPLHNGVLDQCLRLGVTPLAWSPLAGGHLALPIEAARRRSDGERLAAVIQRLEAIAQREGLPRSAVALAFVMVHPSAPIPIIGTQRPERIREAVLALRVRLSRQDWYGIVAACRGKPLP
jgi:predicted oxidoreductase